VLHDRFDLIDMLINHLAPFPRARRRRSWLVASFSHSATLDLENMQGERHDNVLAAHNRSKLCNILFTYEFIRPT